MIPNDEVLEWIQAEAEMAVRHTRDISDKHGAETVLAWAKSLPKTPKPDWAEAPLGASHHAFSGDGVGRWYSQWLGYGEPIVTGTTWYPATYKGQSHLELPVGIDWRTTLRKRPEGEQ